MKKVASIPLEKSEVLDINAESSVDMKELKAKGEEKIGKQTVYDKKFCNMLVEHMTNGYDFYSFAKVVGVSRMTLDKWLLDRPNFKEAREVGDEAYYHHWLEIGLRGAKGLIKGYNASTWIFTMKNKFGWKDIVENVAKSDNTVYQVEVTKEGRFAAARPKVV